jgi:hypothetical protein
MISFRSMGLSLLTGAALALIAASSNLTTAEDAAAPEGVYELRTYTTHEGRMPALHARFRDHTIRLFEKHGIKNVMYWTPIDPAKADNTLIYLLWHKSEDAAKKSWDDFRNDPDWVKAREASEKDGKIVAKVESVYMKTTDYSPKAH